MRYSSTLVKIILLSFSLNNLGVYADTTMPTEDSALSDLGSLWRQFYVTVGGHDGGRIASFFLPKDLGKDKCLWWDTGAILTGTSVGYRQILASSWWNQSWFSGVYASFDVMDCLENTTHSNLTPLARSLTLLNVGFELSAARWGQCTLNLYGEPYNPSNNAQAKNYLGVTSKLSFNNLASSVKPFVGFAYSLAGVRSDNLQSKGPPNFTVGTKWIPNTWIDLELKYVHDLQDKLSSLNFGLQVKFNGVNPHINYFKYQYHRPPDQYIPYYAYSDRWNRLSRNFTPRYHRTTNNNIPDYDYSNERNINSLSNSSAPQPPIIHQTTFYQQTKPGVLFKAKSIEIRAGSASFSGCQMEADSIDMQIGSDAVAQASNTTEEVGQASGTQTFSEVQDIQSIKPEEDLQPEEVQARETHTTDKGEDIQSIKSGENLQPEEVQARETHITGEGEGDLGKVESLDSTSD